jgi:hypothetical protein
MNAAKTWSVAGVLIVTAFSLASCGKDEADGDGPGKGGSGSIVPSGGSSGTATAGLTGRGGEPGGGRGGSTGMTESATKLGRACIADADCTDPKAPGLTCVTASDAVLGDGAPPKGLCTAECGSDDDCAGLGAGSLCYPFTEDATTGYCIEGCSFGDAALGEVKCHNRNEFACNPALLQDTGEPCTTTAADCGAGELCTGGTCRAVLTACLPSCRGDIDCAEGTYCDQSFLSGLCVTTKPTGKALGEPCTVPADDAPNEPDGCLGFCQADAETGNAGHCANNCGLGSECGWNPSTKKFDGLCVFGSVLADEPGLGDFAFCGLTCNCAEECNDEALTCSTEIGKLNDTFRGPGLCLSPGETTVEQDQCGTGGAGAGGAGAGGADSGGSGSIAGAPSGEGGAGAAAP